MEVGQDELVRKAVAGDADALSALLELHGPVVAASLDIGRKWQAVVASDDVMQVTYLEAFLRVREFTPGAQAGASFAAWLRKIAENNLRDAIREQERAKRPHPDKRVQAPDDRSYVELVAMLAASGGTPSVAVAAKEVAACIEEALARLPEDYERVIRLYELKGDSIAQAAAEMGRSQGAIKMLLARARDALRDALGSGSRFFTGRP